MTTRAFETILAGLNIDRTLRDAILGDLLEERAELAEATSRSHADRWLRRQMLRSTPALVAAAARTGGWRVVCAMAGAASASLVVIMLLIDASSFVLGTLLEPSTFARLTIVALLIDLCFGAAGGYIAARLGRVSPLGAAFVFGLLALSLAAFTDGYPHVWYRLTLTLLLLPTTLAGGWLRARSIARAGAH